MNLHLTAKRALVTGSSSGIGEAIAKALAAEGVSVVVHGRDTKRTQQVVEEIGASGGEAAMVLGDLTMADEVERQANAAEKAFGGIDILVNNAGGSGEKSPWMEIEAASWATLYDRNVLTIVRLVQRFVPQMRNAGWGRVVNISSGAGVLPAATGADYSAAKAAVNNLTVSLSKDAGKDGVTVNAVSPGPIRTPNLEKAFRKMAKDRGWVSEDDAEWSQVEKAVLEKNFPMALARLGQVEDVAHSVTFLCSDLAGFVTGVNLRVDGGTVPTVS